MTVGASLSLRRILRWLLGASVQASGLLRAVFEVDLAFSLLENLRSFGRLEGTLDTVVSRFQEDTCHA